MSPSYTKAKQSVHHALCFEWKEHGKTFRVDYVVILVQLICVAKV